jgi:hypothetical protein
MRVCGTPEKIEIIDDSVRGWGLIIPELEALKRQEAARTGSPQQPRTETVRITAGTPEATTAATMQLSGRAPNGDSDEAGQAFQYEAGHPFRDEAGHGSDLKPATWRCLRGSWR